MRKLYELTHFALQQVLAIWKWADTFFEYAVDMSNEQTVVGNRDILFMCTFVTIQHFPFI